MDRVEELLTELNDTKDINALIDKRMEGRIKSIHALGDLGDQRSVEPLIEVLNQDLATIKIAAAKALGKIGDARAVNSLLHTMENAERAPTGLMKLIYMRSGIVKGRRIPWCDIKYDLEVAAIQSSLYSEARKAILGIGPPAVGLLVDVFEDDHRNRIWKDVAWLLWQIGDNIAMQAIDRALRHENHHVRAKLLQVLGEIHDV
jgi:HEAT repeat protein